MKVRLLLVEDSPNDAALVLRTLQRGGFDVDHVRVETEAAFLSALMDPWDIVISDFNLPTFSAPAALKRLHEQGRDIPFIIVSGTVGEDLAVSVMREGASDYLMKDNLLRLPEAVRRELREASIRNERAEADLSLRHSEQRFRQLIDFLPDFVLVHRDGNIMFANPSAARILGYDAPSELMGTTLLSHVRDDFQDVVRDRISGIKRSGTIAPMMEQVWLRRDGSDVAIEVTGNRILYDGAPAILVVGRDVTSRRELAMKLMQLDRMASIGTLAAGVAHEINNPLAYVTSNLRFATDELSELKPPPEMAAVVSEIVQALRESIQGTDHMRQIVNDLRMLSRNEDGEAPVSLDVQRAIESAVKLAMGQVRSRAAVIRDFQPVPLVKGREARLAQVVLNLVVNAAQAFPREDSKSQRIIVRVRQAEQAVLIEVEDNGPGMTLSVRARIFEPFFTTKPVGQGTGLGLPISRNLIEGMGGELECETEEGKGTTFRIRLPLTAQ
ncbi:MAG: ATP-binding protein [Myxococcaceae bacterium]